MRNEELDPDDDSKERDIPSLILDSLKKCPTSTRRDLARHILLIGGGTHLPGLGKALSSALNTYLDVNKNDTNYEFRELQGLAGFFGFLSSKAISPPSVLGWVGGSVIGTLDQYGHRVTKEIYMKESKLLPDWMNLKNLTVT